MRADSESQALGTAGQAPWRLKHEWCKKCGICVAFCPRKVLVINSKEYPEMSDPERCARCKMCEMMCPDFAISVAERPKRAPDAATADAGREAPQGEGQ